MYVRQSLQEVIPIKINKLGAYLVQILQIYAFIELHHVCETLFVGIYYLNIRLLPLNRYLRVLNNLLLV